MKEIGVSDVQSGAAVKSVAEKMKSAAYNLGLGFSNSPSKKLSNSSNEKKRPRLILSDSESGDELGERNATPQKVYKLGSDVVEDVDFRKKKRLMLDGKLNKHKSVGVLHRDDNGHEGCMLDKANKHKSVGVLHRNDIDHEEVDNGKESKRTNVRLSNKVKVVKNGNEKRKEGKIKGASYSEKQLLREKIKKMLFGAGWTIDYRPRRNRDYLDSVYISPGGSAYWSITKAYDALRKEEKNSSKAGTDFTPLPTEILNKLTRQTRKKAEKVEKSKLRVGNSGIIKKVKKKKSLRHVEKLEFSKSHKHKLSDGRFKEVSEDSDHYASDDLGKKTPRKDDLRRSRSRVDTNSTKSGKIGRLTLMGRGSNEGKILENSGVVTYSGKRTLLSWLIDSGVVSVGEKVEYMNLRRTRVMQNGWITEDGLHCDCCSKVITVSRFELHAGSKLGQPFQNLFVQSGKTLLQCLIDGWNKQKESERKGFYDVDVNGDDPNDDTCGLCGDGGDLICCDGCPSTFHLSCLDMKMLPQGDWHCPNCACKYCHKVGGHRTKAYGSRTKSSLSTCHLCEKKYHKTCSPEINDEPIDLNDLNFTFCGQKCQELYIRLQKLLWIKHELDSGFSWSLIHRSDPLPDASSVYYPQRVECNSKLAVAQSVMDECFLPIIDRRSGITVIHNVVYNCGSNFSRLNYSGFFTAILERGDEMICAASIRIHGAQLAEMPFIGTRNLYRRQGMCKRLFQAIESALSSLEVEKLIIPAVEEHMNTWTNAFGFSAIEKSQKQEMRSFNLLVFPGTDMLQKPLMNHEGNEKGKKGGEVHESSNPLTEKSELINESGNPTEPEIQSSENKSDPQFDTNVLKGTIHHNNDVTKGTASADSCSIVEVVDLQNENVTGIEITDACSIQPQVPNGASHGVVSTKASDGSQIVAATKDFVFIDAFSDSVMSNDNVTNAVSLKTNLQL
ncbi:uncharacterized protein [Rutidosis leptorrhynchoides]|uniref:uncharacterized protein n=1 Tax=Rutidosis leptorrhynchoides TaxID=125765 RepID=UPI003A991C4A